MRPLPHGPVAFFTPASLTLGGEVPYTPERPPRGLSGHVAELADALDLGSSGATHQSSTLCVPSSKIVPPRK